MVVAIAVVLILAVVVVVIFVLVVCSSTISGGSSGNINGHLSRSRGSINDDSRRRTNSNSPAHRHVR